MNILQNLVMNLLQADFFKIVLLLLYHFFDLLQLKKAIVQLMHKHLHVLFFFSPQKVVKKSKDENNTENTFFWNDIQSDLNSLCDRS